MPEHILILAVAGSKHYKLRILGANLVHHIGHQIQTLLIRQPGHKSDHKFFLILLQAQFSLKSQFIFHF